MTEIASLVGSNECINISGIILKKKVKNKFSYKIYSFTEIPSDCDAIILTEISDANNYYRFLRKKFPKSKIFIPEFLKISK